MFQISQTGAFAARASREEDRPALLQQMRMIKRGSEEAVPEEQDR